MVSMPTQLRVGLEGQVLALTAIGLQAITEIELFFFLLESKCL